MSKQAILLINVGTPNSPTAGMVGKYLTQFLNDKRVIDVHPVLRFILVNIIIVPLFLLEALNLLNYINAYGLNKVRHY